MKSVDTSAAKAMEGVIVAKDGDFVGVAAPTSYLAKQAIEAIAPTAEWEHRITRPATNCSRIWKKRARRRAGQSISGMNYRRLRNR